MQVNSMREKLMGLSPTELEIIDDGALHVGHGAEGGHYTVMIASPKFEGKNLIQCHRLVYQALGDMVGNEIHAVSIKIK